jgi:hypothetical protein
MKKPIYAALDLHSRHSVLGSMDHDGQTQPRMRFATEANILRAQVERLRQRRRTLYLTMGSRSAHALGQRDCASAGGPLDHLRAAAQLPSTPCLRPTCQNLCCQTEETFHLRTPAGKNLRC